MPRIAYDTPKILFGIFGLYNVKLMEIDFCQQESRTTDGKNVKKCKK